MPTGKIVRFDTTRGYGFIAPDQGREDVFVHANALAEEKHIFTPGVPVEFDVVESHRGFKAVDVRVLQRTAAPPGSRWDTLTVDAFHQQLDDLFVERVPTLTAAQAARLREHLVALAMRRGWVTG